MTDVINFKLIMNRANKSLEKRFKLSSNDNVFGEIKFI